MPAHADPWLSTFLLLAPAAAHAAQCELQRIEPLPGLPSVADVVLDGNLALLAIPFEAGLGIQALERDDGGTPDVPEDDAWVLVDALVPAFHFTSNLALSGDLLLASGPGELEGEGEVFVLERRPGGWLELDHLRPPEPGWRDGFGHALAVRGSTLLIGSPTDSHSGLQYQGSAGFYERDDRDTRDPLDDAWVETQRVSGLPFERGSFGHEVVLAEELAAVSGAAFPYTDSSAVYLYARRPGNPSDPLDDEWVEVEVFTSPHVFESDWFGTHLALSPDFLFVSAPGAAKGNGAVFVYARREQGAPDDPSDDAWVSRPPLTAPGTAPGQFRGGALSVSGNRLLVGWPLAEERAGSARLYRRIDVGVRGDPTDDLWLFQAELRPADVVQDSYFGESVALQGGTALVTSLGSLHALSSKCVRPDLCFSAR